LLSCVLVGCRRRRRENDPHALLQEYVEWYVWDGQGPREEVPGYDFYSLDALEEGLEDTVNLIVAREDGREYTARKAREEAARREEEDKAAAAASRTQEVRRGERNKARRESASEKKGRGRGRKREDEEEEDKALYCVCQLPEGESNSRTMVNCEECKDW
jgi:DNA-directed RNA polymerase subunit M/transcription elongation factor TFIIS